MHCHDRADPAAELIAMLVDVHQHVWTEPFIEALEQRDSLPFIRRDRGLVTLYLAGEPPCVLDLSCEAPAERAQLVSSDGLDRALVCISSPIGVEALPRPEAELLLGAYHTGALALGPQLGAWGAIALDAPHPDDVDDRRDRGCAGLSLPAGALADPVRARDVVPVLERAQELGFPVFIHPGPAPWSQTHHSWLSQPLWWPAMTRYVADMSAAWLTFVSILRAELPDLRIVFAMLAGGAPLLAERLHARSGGRYGLDPDPHLFYETSSFGLRAIESIAATVGSDQLVYGSDRPVIEPPRDNPHLRLAGNAQRIFQLQEVAASAA